MIHHAITVSSLGKRYRIGTQGPSYRTLRQAIGNLACAPLKRFRRLSGKLAPSETFWALQGVDFDVRPGEVVGIIGRNGAGKSTLLKILSRITEPSTGRATIRGRVGSLLEVGTGFHPELTGRENIYLNGVILGMTKAEIRRKFDDIVDFSEVEAFLDTPVKRYSSGMYVRLAFAVAAHLEPEILIVDEVLSVGDAAFQKKCIGKMQGAAGNGRTILFVSHNMAAVSNLCQRVLLLEDGILKLDGEPSEVIGEYLRTSSPQGVPLEERTDRQGSGELRITEISFRDVEGRPIDAACSGQDVEVVVRYKAEPGFRPRNLIVSLEFTTLFDVPVFMNHNRLTGDQFELLPEEGMFVCRLYRLPLPPATYRISCSVLLNDDYVDSIINAVELNVISGKFFSTGEIPPATHGICLVDGNWRVEPSHTTPTCKITSGDRTRKASLKT